MRIVKLLGLAAGLSLAIVSSAFAIDYDITDNYIGKGDSRDVIGGYRYDVYGMTVDRSDSGVMTVRIYTKFVDHVGTYEYGDLLMTTSGWNPYGSAPYYGDDFQRTGTTWEYAYDLNGARDTQGSFVDHNSAELVQMQYPSWSGSYEYGSERYDGHSVNDHIYRVNDRYTTSLGGGSVEANTADNYLEFIFDVSGTSLATANQIAFHWTMSCANDIIEGVKHFNGTTVSEPAVMSLLLAGVAGLLYRRRRLRLY
ncbi:hypothetical protein [Luteithermobacter gelatinilyticus]|uniref:hypothetical protein n=1 Tax=Luteithermobacter gelatinilyticus TaxID=2582913 RepID=UPI001105803C|nr:hypothetical protein [Luteithermobacter gelatinilyticus]